ADAPFLWRALPVGGKKKKVFSGAAAGRPGRVGRRGSPCLLIRGPNLATDHPHSTAQGSGRFRGVSALSGRKPAGAPGATALSVAAESKQRPAEAARLPRLAAVASAFGLRVSPPVVV